MTELIQHQTAADLTLNDQMRYAETVSRAALLPQAYRGKPADILIATGLGNAIGIAPAQALYEIYVVNGRPSPSANLMAALVRRAGHKLRIQGDDTQCTATIVRADDPDYPMSATWTIKKAQDAKLTGKDTWRQFPGAMLRARAISEVVRMAAPEAVMGMEYSREEVEQIDDRPTAAATPAAKPKGMAGLRAAVATEPEPDEEPPAQAETLPVDEPDARYWRKRLFATLNERGIADADEQRNGIGHILGRPIESRSELSEEDAERVVSHLNREQ